MNEGRPGGRSLGLTSMITMVYMVERVRYQTRSLRQLTVAKLKMGPLWGLFSFYSKGV